MEDIIKRILEIDKQAREMTGDAEDFRKNADKEIAKKTGEISGFYHDKMLNKLTEIENRERNHAETVLDQKQKENEKILEDLNSKYEKNHDIWVKDIVDRVTK